MNRVLPIGSRFLTVGRLPHAGRTDIFGSPRLSKLPPLDVLGSSFLHLANDSEESSEYVKPILILMLHLTH